MQRFLQPQKYRISKHAKSKDVIYVMLATVFGVGLLSKNLWISSEIFGNLREMIKHILTTFEQYSENFPKSSEIFGKLSSFYL